MKGPRNEKNVSLYYLRSPPARPQTKEKTQTPTENDYVLKKHPIRWRSFLGIEENDIHDWKENWSGISYVSRTQKTAGMIQKETVWNGLAIILKKSTPGGMLEDLWFPGQIMVSLETSRKNAPLAG